MTRIARPFRSHLLPAAVLAAVVAVLLWPAVSGRKVMVAGDFYKVWLPWGAALADGQLPHNTDLSDNVLYYLPVRDYAAASLRTGRIPLWNPYMFAGTPFLASGESGVFSPTNVLFLLMRAPVAMGYTAALQLVLAGLFFYALMRRLGLGVPSALFGSIVYMLNGFFIVWLEMLNLVAVALWIPLVLLLLDRWIAKRSAGAALALTGVIAVQFLAGFLQMSLYLLMAALGWAVFRAAGGEAAGRTARVGMALGGLAAMSLAGAALAAVQLVPHVELIALGQRDATPVAWTLVNRDHLRHLITLVRPDHFGSPVGHTYHGVPNYTELCGYVGLLPLLAAVAGARPRAHFAAPYFMATAAVALLLFLETPLHWLMCLFVPGYRLGIGASRAIVLFTFAVAALAAIGVEQLLGRDHPRPRWRLALAALVMVAGTAELLRFGTRHLTVVDEALARPTAPAITFLAGIPGPWRMTSTPGVFPPNSPMSYRIEDVDGYESLYSRRQAEYLSLSATNARLLDALNVRFLVTDQRRSDPDLALRYDGEVRIYERTRALPRAFVVWRFRRLARGGEVLAALGAAGFDPSREALLEEDPGIGAPAEPGSAEVTIVSRRPEEVVVRAALTAPGLLVLGDSTYPGWEVRVDGRPRPLLVADHVLRAVALPSGEHEVAFVFRPRSFRLGAAVSVTTLAILGAAARSGWRRARRRAVG